MKTWQPAGWRWWVYRDIVSHGHLDRQRAPEASLGMTPGDDQTAHMFLMTVAFEYASVNTMRSAFLIDVVFPCVTITASLYP